MDDGLLVFDVDGPASEVIFELLDDAGEAVRRRARHTRGRGGYGATLDLGDVGPGTKVLRITRAKGTG